MKSPIEKLTDAVCNLEEELQYEVESAEDELHSLLKCHDLDNEDRPYHSALHKVMEPIGKLVDLVSNVEGQLGSMQEYVVQAEEQVSSCEEKLDDYNSVKTMFKELSPKGKRALVRLLMAEGVFEMYDESFIAELISFDETEKEVQLFNSKAGAMK